MKSKRDRRRNKPGCVFRATRRHPVTGKLLYAADYGYKAWPIRIK